MKSDFTKQWRNQLPSWLERIGPQLWKHRQHDPRPLRTPAHYSRVAVPNNAPQIAIVTPSYNQAKFLRSTIESLLNQNYPRLHYFVQDGGSTDDSRKILSSYGSKLSWQSEPDAGQSNAINKGFTHASGEIMAYLNSDDVLLPGTLAYVAEAFLTYSDVDVIYGHRIYIDENGFEIGRWLTPSHDSTAIKWSDIIPQETMFWRRRVWDAIGPFDESFRFALDWDFILRAQAAGFKFKRVPRFIGCFRVHDQQKTTRMMKINEEEANRLRIIHLGRKPSETEMLSALRPYLWRHVILQHLYRLGMIRH